MTPVGIVHGAPAVVKAGALAVGGIVLVAEVITNNSSPLVTVLVAVIAAVTTLGGIYLTRRVNQVHVLVNSKMDAALARVIKLEEKLGLAADEPIPSAAIVTQGDTGLDSTIKKEGA